MRQLSDIVCKNEKCLQNEWSLYNVTINKWLLSCMNCSSQYTIEVNQNA